MVLAIFIPVIGCVLLVGYFAASPKNNLWHADGGWFLFVVAAGLFVLMLWILTRIAATKHGSAQPYMLRKPFRSWEPDKQV